MRASRLLSILLVLQNRGRTPAQALADEFEVSVRTIYRDVEHLSAAGVPVYAERGRTGGFQLLDGYRTRLTGLTPAEAEALFLTGLPGPAADLGLGEAVAAAQLKLLAALPGERREGAARTAARFHLDPVGWYRQAEQAQTLPTLAEAVWTARRLRIRYASWTSVMARELEPLGLVLKGGAWYLVAQSSGKARTYRIAAIEALETTDQTFARPAGFDLAAYWTTWTKDFEARLYRGRATLRVSPEGMRRLSRLAMVMGEVAAQSDNAPDAEGWRVVEIPVELDSLDHAAAELLKLGDQAEVLSPPDLRHCMTQIAARLGALYSESRMRGSQRPGIEPEGERP